MFNNLRHASAILFCQELPRFSRNLSPWINWVPGYRQTERYAVGFHTLIQETMFDHTLIHTNILPAAETLPADTTTAPLTGIPTVTMPRPPTTLQNGAGHQGSPIEPSRIERFEPSAEILSRKDIRRRMLEIARASFPDGIPRPYTTLRNDGHNLPFVRANVRIFSDDEEESQGFEEFCLWDTGADISYILCSKLRVKGQGFVTAQVQIDGYPTEFDTTFVHREQLPNDTEFIILGQRNLIENIEATTTPKSLEGPPLSNDAHRYGSLTLLRYCNPVTGDITVY